jgi:uncharacterized protein (UPF0305 family)
VKRFGESRILPLILAALGGVAIFLAMAAKAGSPIDETVGAFDPTFLYRSLVSVLLSVALYWLRSISQDLKEAQTKVTAFLAVREQAIANATNITVLFDKINALRDQVNRDYHTKQETQEHRQNVEKTLTRIENLITENSRQTSDRMQGLTQAYLGLRADKGQRAGDGA